MSRSPRLAAESLACVLPDGRTLLADLSLGLTDERVGLVGPNGSGKSTLLAVLAGARAPSRGVVRRPGRIAWLPQDARTRLPHDATVADALGLGDALAAVRRVEAGSLSAHDHDLAADGWQAVARADALLERLGLAHLSHERAVCTLSGGEASRVLLAGCLLTRPDVLLLDEPTNHLDAPARDAVCGLLAGWRGALLVASHDRALLAHVDRILELSPLGARWYGGAYAEYAAQQSAEQDAAQRDLAQATRERVQEKRAAQEQRERAARRASGGARRAERRGASAIERHGAIERASGSAGRRADDAAQCEARATAAVQAARARVDARTPVAFDILGGALAPAARLVTLDHVLVEFAGGRVLGPLSLAVRGDTRLAVTGPNGSGKSTLLALLAGDPVGGIATGLDGHVAGGPDGGLVGNVAGALAVTRGTIQHHVPRAAIARLAQESAASSDPTTMHDRLAAAQPTLDRTAVHTRLAAFGFRAAATERPVAGLSGGERLRLALACALSAATPPALLLLDEPTNHLDLDAIAALEAALRRYRGALVVVSHDEAFLEAIGVTDRLPLGPAR